MKKGQIYILAAIILCLAIFGIVTIANKAQRKGGETNFESLSENYATESSKLINSLLSTTPDQIPDTFRDFSVLFTAYSKTQNPDFGLIYAFNYQNKLYIGNFLKTDITLIDPSPGTVIHGCYDKIPATITFQGFTLDAPIDVGAVEDCTEELDAANSIKISIPVGAEEYVYSFNLPQNQPEVIIVSFEAKVDERKVFMEGEFVPPEAGAP